MIDKDSAIPWSKVKIDESKKQAKQVDNKIKMRCKEKHDKARQKYDSLKRMLEHKVLQTICIVRAIEKKLDELDYLNIEGKDSYCCIKMRKTNE